MFKPFSPTDLKSESESLADTKAVPGEKWRRWQLDELPNKQQMAAKQAEAANQTFVKDAELAALREQARQEAWEQGFAEGNKSGYETGYNEGLTAARAAVEAEKQQLLAAAVTPVTEMAAAFSAALAQMNDDIAEHIVSLALATGAKLAREHLAANPELVLKVVRELLHSEPMFTAKPRLLVNAEDFGLIESHMHDELAAAGWRLLADERLSRGGCRLVSQTGERDASWETRWETICAEFADANGPAGDNSLEPDDNSPERDTNSPEPDANSLESQGGSHE